MHGQHEDDIRPFEDTLEGVADLVNAIAKVLAAVAGSEDDLATLVARRDARAEQREAGRRLDHCARGVKRVDDRIAGDEDLRPRHILEIEHLGGASGRREMLVGDLRDEPSVHLLRPWFVDIAAAQSRLDVRDGYAPIEGGQRADHGARGVALHDDAIRLGLIVDLSERHQQAGAELIQRLVRLHDVEIEVGLDPGQRKDRIEQIAMLCGYADLRAQRTFGIELVDDGEEF